MPVSSPSPRSHPTGRFSRSRGTPPRAGTCRSLRCGADRRVGWRTACGRTLPGGRSANRVRILTWGAGPSAFAVGGEFSPDGRLLLFRRWRRLLAVDVETGRVSFVADDPAPGALGWLSDGRVAFVDRRRRLMFVRPGGRPI